MSGRRNYQTTYYQRVRKNLWQISWVSIRTRRPPPRFDSN